MRVVANFPEELWTRLKSWAKAHAMAGRMPTLRDCEQHIGDITTDLTAGTVTLRPDVIEFYAKETMEMATRFAAQHATSVEAAG